MVAQRLVVCGVGLIGGSVALGARAAGCVEQVVGVDPDAGVLEQALALKVVDSVGLPDDLGSDDLVLIAAPTLAAESVLRQLAGLDYPHGAPLITDTASVKGNLVALWQTLGAPAPFVPGHPIAGSERSGVAAADARLFQDHRVVLTPTPDNSDAALQRVQALWEALGARVSCMDVAEHDEVLAMTSHLPHLLAFALVDTLGRQPQHEQIFGLAAGGFRDFTRIASSDPVMWSEICIANSGALLSILDALQDDLGGMRRLVEQGDSTGLRSLFARAKGLRDTHVLGLDAGAGGSTTDD